MDVARPCYECQNRKRSQKSKTSFMTKSHSRQSLQAPKGTTTPSNNKGKKKDRQQLCEKNLERSMTIFLERRNSVSTGARCNFSNFKFVRKFENGITNHLSRMFGQNNVFIFTHSMLTYGDPFVNLMLASSCLPRDFWATSQ